MGHVCWRASAVSPKGCQPSLLSLIVAGNAEQLYIRKGTAIALDTPWPRWGHEVLKFYCVHFNVFSFQCYKCSESLGKDFALSRGRPSCEKCAGSKISLKSKVKNVTHKLGQRSGGALKTLYLRCMLTWTDSNSDTWNFFEKAREKARAAKEKAKGYAEVSGLKLSKGGLGKGSGLSDSGKSSPVGSEIKGHSPDQGFSAVNATEVLNTPYTLMKACPSCQNPLQLQCIKSNHVVCFMCKGSLFGGFFLQESGDAAICKHCYGRTR